MSGGAAAVHDTDVLIVGAGPSGAVLGLLLAQAGVDVTLVDRAPSVYLLPRAAHVDHEAMRVFQALGVADEVVDTCRHVPRYDFVNAAGDVLLRFDRPDAIGAGGWPMGNMIHQPSIERALHEAVAAAPRLVLRRSLSLDALDQDEDGVTARLSADDGTTKTIRARYLVGADGTRSRVREACGIALDDLHFDEPWLVIDALVHDASRLPSVNIQLCDPKRPTSCVTMGCGRHRWEFMMLPGETAEQVSADGFVAELLRPWDVEGAITVERKAVYRFNARVATRWRKDRVLLAGDAAHQMPPFAGQGLCSGLRDSANLAWKLGAVLAGAPAEPLLDSYQVEREPHVRAIIDLAIMMGRTVCLLDPQAAAERDRQMIGARASGAAAPVLGAWPPLKHGCLLADTTAAGGYFPQFLGAASERMDDVLGTGAWLISRGDPPATSPTIRAVGTADPDFTPFRREVETWLDEAGTDAVLVRPDRYVFGTGDARKLERAWRAATAPVQPLAA